jgi:hypothetical protein
MKNLGIILTTIALADAIALVIITNSLDISNKIAVQIFLLICVALMGGILIMQLDERSKKA